MVRFSTITNKSLQRSKIKLNETIITIPAIALRGITIMPSGVAHFDVSRKKSIKALEAVMIKDQRIFLITQKDPDFDHPTKDDLFAVGTVVEVKQVIKMQGGLVRVLVEGIERGTLQELEDHEEYLIAKVELVSEKEKPARNMLMEEAKVRSLQEAFIEYTKANPKLGVEFQNQIMNEFDLQRLIDLLSMNLSVPQKQKQKILEAFSLDQQFEILMETLFHEADIAKIKSEFQIKVKEKIDKNQKEYILREEMKLIREELGEDNTVSDADAYSDLAKKLKADKAIKEKILKEIDRFKNISSNSSESAVLRGYIETLLELPWGKSSKDSVDLVKAEQILNEDHYGLDKVKERMLEFLAVRSLMKKGQSPIICLVGPPGTGKTSIAKSIARALDKEYVRISLGGVRDEAEIRGHRRTYVGAMPGRLVNGLRQAGVNNPLMLLDEIDKASSDYKGDTSAALLEVLDSDQNSKFRDHYVEIPIDLSEVFFIATANNLSDIPRPLLDRMEIIEVTSYTENEKFHIAKEHLLPKQLLKNGLDDSHLKISDAALRKMISGYTKESGVRSLERKIGEICRKAAKEFIEKNNKCVRVNENNVEKYLGKIKFEFDQANNKPDVGIVRGLAWTSVGGETLQIEVNVMPGKGELKLTGQLGDVMKESALAGLSYIRSLSGEYHISKEFFQENDIHIHIPEGAVPKDGPSAGITMATAVLSAITNRRVRADIAMTGEITLRGRVLPIGGLKEKILAAKNANLKIVCVPKKNEPDIRELSDEITKGVEIRFVETLHEVLEIAFVDEKTN